MPQFSLNAQLLRTALARVGELMPADARIELLLVGGAAGLLSGLLPGSRTTLDCDVMVYAPPHSWHRVEQAAHRVGKEMGLATSWLNSVVQLRADSLADGWRERRVLVGTFGPLQVWAVSRIDLIAMKFIAHRPQDVEDLLTLEVNAADLAFVRSYLLDLRSRNTPKQEIDEALEILEDWSAVA